MDPNGSRGALPDYFELRPTRAAKVSEISEATASSAIEPEERVNFHIGNPVQESRLSSAYLRAVLGLDIRDETLSEEDPPAILRALDLDDAERPVLDFFGTLIRRSAPYLPRGGFSRSAPPPLAAAFSDWLQNQQDPLTYDLGKTSDRREIVFASGGTAECIRVFFHALSLYLAHLPARILLFRTSLPPHVMSFPGLQFESLPAEEHAAVSRLRQIAAGKADGPTFVVMGEITTEETRRTLRGLALTYPLLFLEINDAPNHHSLARESRLIDRVIRFLSPAIFSPRFRNLSIVFVAGNADFLSLLETLHFQLKGTPSASEVELLTYLLGHPPPAGDPEPGGSVRVEPPLETPPSAPGAGAALARFASRIEQRLDVILSPHRGLLDTVSASLGRRATSLVERSRYHAALEAVDRFEGTDAPSLLHDLCTHLQDADWLADLEESFLRSFVRHHPEYAIGDCAAVSGSARTALSLLGFHCGIREAVIPDLSWTYEHCFPSVHTVPLAPEFGLDTGAIVDAVQAKLRADPHWAGYGAVVLNNPHNATGRVFETSAVRELLRELLGRGITVIDDLSYQNVAPVRDLPEIPTLRQIAEGLIAAGRITSAQGRRLITVHSLSKTDCLAGARLSVIEIRDPLLMERFRTLIDSVTQNTGAILLAYLFYRNHVEVARAYWRLRNTIFFERMQALDTAQRNLPADRNPFAIEILGPAGSMYPLMVVGKLPAGLSLDWVAAGLARQGIGLVPLSTFARTEKGFDAGRKAFRLTLGGTDGAPVLLNKTRRVLIDLNRVIGEEAAQYSRKQFPLRRRPAPPESLTGPWKAVEDRVRELIGNRIIDSVGSLRNEISAAKVRRLLTEEYVPERLAVFRRRLCDREMITGELMASARADNGRALGRTLEREFYRDDISRREEAFRSRLYDRTVHPTQMYSIRAEAAFENILGLLARGAAPSAGLLTVAARELVNEFLGLNVAISSGEESDEILLDLDAHVNAELYGEIQEAGLRRTFLSFWGDWDGSNRPSGQGHQLAASVLLRNVERLSHILVTLSQSDRTARIRPELLAEIERLPRKTRRFVELLKDITTLTHQLERRYRGILPFQSRAGRLRRVGMALHLARDPVTSLWYHNDRLERHMMELRTRRREGLEYYFALNKSLRKELHSLIPALIRNAGAAPLLRDAVLYRDLLQRFVITPRIHQSMITAQDPFAVDTTVFNISEINEIGSRYGNPGMVLSLQVSMSTRPGALIELDRKLRARREHVLRDHPDIDMPALRLIPLFEDPDAVRGMPAYLNKLWEYSLQSRRVNQETRDRFAEVVEELFIAGSDLSQQVGQPAGAQLYRQAKYELLHWLAKQGLAERVRLKLGSGEPMQRGGGYYNSVSGEAAFVQSEETTRRFASHLRASTRRSTVYATTPMLGVFAGGDLRTFQSAIAERLRHMSVNDFAQLRYHLGLQQGTHRRDLRRASEEFAESRLTSTARSERALERLTVGTREPALEGFLNLLTENFRQILYGRDEDVVGIHIISYFIARTTPPLRDRPTVRPGPAGKGQGNRILERIAETIPFSRYGSLLRAIAHNQAQTAVLGINQLTTGLFRALDTFSRLESVEGNPETYLADRILPHLPVYEILRSLRLYHDVDETYLRAIERAFPAGNSAFLALREDLDAMERYIPLFQQELLRRHGVDVGDFFEGIRFIPDLLPTLRPDLAVLLQPDFFNTDPERLQDLIGMPVEVGWRDAVARLLAAPAEIRRWRAGAWALLESPVFQRVEAFVELAVALYSLSGRKLGPEVPLTGRPAKIPSRLDSFFRMSHADDEMRQFLAAATEYLTIASEGMVEVPANIIRAMKEVERIAAIEEQALSGDKQDRLRFYLLQIARITGENG
jgi:aspartate/methionine/tyrosine aminotransferase